MELLVSKKSLKSPITIHMGGAKNALLHLIFAALIPKSSTSFSNVPTTLYDYVGAKSILNWLGVTVTELDQSNIVIHHADIEGEVNIPLEYTKKTRCSLMLLGALLKRKGKVRIGFPGGCSFSDRRPFDIHLEGLQALGAEINISDDAIEVVHIEDKDAVFAMRFPSVGATMNLLMYAVTGRATVVLENVAIEPEVVTLVEYLNKCGGRIEFDAEARRIEVMGVKALYGCDFRIIYDRIQTMTYVCLALMHKVDVNILGIDSLTQIQTPLDLLESAGAEYFYDAEQQQLSFFGSRSKLKGVNIVAEPYPAFPTDLQPIFSAMLLTAEGSSRVKDLVYPERVKYIDELRLMGAPIEVNNGVIEIKPLMSHLVSASMKSYDLRAGMACLMLGSLCDESSTITQAQQIFRGYDHMIENMSHFMQVKVVES